MSEISVVIQAFDGYSDYWPTWYWCWTRYWDFSLPWEIIFCTEEKSPPWNDPRIKHFKTGKVKLSEYSIKSIRIAEAVESPYLFYMVDDFWLTDRVDQTLFSDLLSLVKSANINCLKIQCNQDEYHRLEKTNIFCHRRRLLKYSPDSPWVWNTQASIWRRGFFLDTIVAGENPWEMEANGTMRIHQLAYDPQVYLFHWPWYTVPSAIWKGQLSEPAKQIQYTANSDLLTTSKYDLFGLQSEEKMV